MECWDGRFLIIGRWIWRQISEKFKNIRTAIVGDLNPTINWDRINVKGTMCTLSLQFKSKDVWVRLIGHAKLTLVSGD